MSQGPEAFVDNSRQLTDEDSFNFTCSPDRACFTACCYDLNLVLMPHDILCLKNRLGMKSGDFLKRYTSVHVGQGSGLPVVMLKMEGANLKCPFLEEAVGCSIYEDRPGACRTYPLARMACRGKDREEVEEFYYVVREPDCQGFKDGRQWTVRTWKENEILAPYNEMNDVFGELLQAKTEAGIPHLNADQIETFYLGCYDIDGFRQFFLEGPNLDRFIEREEVIQAISQDEQALLRYALRWVKKKLFQQSQTCCNASCGT